MGQIGQPMREIEFVPLENPVPQPMPAHVPQKEHEHEEEEVPA